MEIQTISSLSIAGMIFSALISMGLPIVLCILARTRLKTNIAPFFIGCGTFFVFAMILEQILHTVVFLLAGRFLTEHLVLYALYAGLAAAVFEETGRFLSMKLFMKKQLTRENSVMYGIGHGGIEAILIVGLTYISNLIVAFTINTGAMESSLSLLDDSLRDSTIQSISALWTTPGSTFFIAGIERILAICLQICLSVLVYQALASKKMLFWAAALGIHFLVDFAVVLAANYIPVAAVELLLLVFVAITAFYTLQVYKKAGASQEISQEN